MGVVIGVHDGTADSRSDAHVSLAAGLTDGDEAVFDVADFTDGSSAVHSDGTNFAGRKSYLSKIAFLCDELCSVSCSSAKLSALAGLQFDAVDQSTDGDVCKGKGVAGLDVCFSTAEDDVADLESFGSDDVLLLAVCIADQCDECASVRIVFDGLDSCGDAILVSLEVDDSLPPRKSVVSQFPSIVSAESL